MNSKRLRIGIIDYGMGNLHSAAKSLALQGGDVMVTDSRTRLNQADLLVLPGVGSFGAAMKNLGRKKLDGFVQNWIQDERPFLGICLGLQLLFQRSEEDPGVRGLGIFRGPVVRFRPESFKKGRFQIPHMGWNVSRPAKGRGKDLFKGIKPADRFYFVHSYFPAPVDRGVILSRTPYGGEFCSTVRHKSVFATQFHPEKSGRVGLRLLRNVIDSARAASKAKN